MTGSRSQDSFDPESRRVEGEDYGFSHTHGAHASAAEALLQTRVDGGEMEHHHSPSDESPSLVRDPSLW